MQVKNCFSFDVVVTVSEICSTQGRKIELAQKVIAAQGIMILVPNNHEYKFTKIFVL